MAVPVHLLGGAADGLLSKGHPRSTEEHSTSQPEIEANRRGFVNDNDAQSIGMIEHLLGVGIVRGAERIGTRPLHQLEVVHHGHVVVAPAADLQILVLAEAPEVEGLAVDEDGVPSMRTLRMPTGTL